jgi:hypothetical protein
MTDLARPIVRSPKRAEAWAKKALARISGLTPGVHGATSLMRFAIGTGAAQTSTTTLPAGAVVVSATLDVQTPYTAGATIAIGSAASPSLLLGTGDNAPQFANAYTAEQDTVWTVPGTVLVTIAGAPAAGAGEVLVQYSIAPNP